MSDDLIRREDAIKALRLEYPMIPMFKSLREEWAIKTEGFRKAEEVIIKLPSADRPQGEWKITDAWPHNVYCSECYKTFAQTRWEVWEDGSLPRKFCPNCGAKMKGADDE